MAQVAASGNGLQDSPSNANKTWEERKSEALEAVMLDGQALGSQSEDLRADKDLVLTAVKYNWTAFQHAGGNLAADRDFVLEAVRQHGCVLQYASSNLRADKEVVCEAVKQSGIVLQFASPELRGDRAIVLQAVTQSGAALGCAGCELRADKEVVLRAVKQSGYALHHASQDLKSNKEVVLEAVKHSGAVLQYASSELRADKEVVLQAVQQDGHALAYASNELKADKEVVFEAVKRAGEALQYANEKVQTDKDLLLLASRMVDSDDWTALLGLHPNAQAILKHSDFHKANASNIAVQGEAAPILTATLTCSLREAGWTYVCEAFLMSGTRIEVSFPRNRGRAKLSPAVKHGPGNVPDSASSIAQLAMDANGAFPILSDLAGRLVTTMSRQAEVVSPSSVFINFVINEAGDTMPVTPWDWNGSLHEFMLAPGEETDDDEEEDQVTC